jgi:hypothetical protein
MDLNVCTLVILRYHTFSNYPPYPLRLFPWAQQPSQQQYGQEITQLTRSDYHPLHQALPRFGQNAEGAHERAAERSVVDKGSGTGCNQGRTRHSKPTSADHQKALRHLCCGVQTVGHHPHRPNRPTPNYLAMMLLVHHGGHPSGCKLHLLQVNKEPNRQNDHSLSKIGQQDEALSTWAKTSPFGQGVFWQHSKHALQKTR